MAVVYLIANRRYPLDTLAAPGPGVFPLGVGLFLLVAAGLQAVGALRARRTGPAFPAHEPAAARPPLRMAALLVAWVAVIPAGGFLPASFALVLLSSRLLGAVGWLRPAALALGVTAVAWALFGVWLGVPLPAGFFR